MSEKFTASNGYKVWGSFSRLKVDYPGNPECSLTFAETDALQEYFQHRRDRELGRWRSKKHPDYVVYPGEGGPDVVGVLSERDGRFTWEYRGERPERDFDDYMVFFEVAEEYFEAHPSKKPWEDVQTGEVWQLFMSDGMRHYVTGKGGCFVGVDARGFTDTVKAADTRIIDGRRIWPEVSDGA